MAVIAIKNEVMKFDEVIKRLDGKFLRNNFTEKERAYFEANNMNPRHICGFYCIKRALVHALGLETDLELVKLEIEITVQAKGKIQIELKGETNKAAQEAGVKNVHATVAYSDPVASVFILLES